jgi:ribosomal protein L14
MGYIAKEISTNKVYYSKGANKIADKVGCNYSTITKFFKPTENLNKGKVIKGYIISKTIDISNQSRGINIKFNV